VKISGEIWTIGHSSRSIENFLKMLSGHEIETIADVRRFPGSRRYPHFSGENLAKSLKEMGVDYIHFPELGGRRTALKNSSNTAWRNAAFRGYADFMMTNEFEQGIERLLKIAEAKRTAMMCAEALWWQCHRSLIADHLKAIGKTVLHISSEKKAEEHPYTSAARIVNGKLSYAGEKELFSAQAEV
jgi:uncharacterized protein (DUF488 family)